MANERLPRNVRRVFRAPWRTALVGVGLLGGLALSLAGTRLLNAYLYRIAGRDPVTYATISVVLGAAALVAAYLPARRAMRVDPVVALSAE